MAQKQVIDAMWDDSPIDVSTEVNFIWSIANKLRGTYQSDKYKDVIIPMVIIRRFECALEPTKDKVVAQFKANPNYPAKAMYRISGFQFYNTSEFTLKELINDADHLAANFKAYLQSFSPNVQEIIVSAEKGLDFYKQIDKMDKMSKMICLSPYKEINGGSESIYDHVQEGYTVPNQVIAYLRTTELYFMCPGIYERPFKPGQRLLGPYAYTDGKYYWDRDTWKYVLKYHVTLPQEFVDYAMSDEGAAYIENFLKESGSWSDKIQDWKKEEGYLCLLPDDAGDVKLEDF